MNERGQLNISLQQLRAFASVARLGSFADAAKAMHLTPAALSLLVGSLEREVGFRVFHRTTRRVELSEQGHAYLPHAERVIDQMRAAHQIADEIRLRSTGHVRIAMTPLMQLTVLPPVFAAFRQRWPHISLELLDVPTDQVLASVDGGQADLAISYAMPVVPRIDAELLFTSPLVAVISPQHRLSAQKSLHWLDLRDEPLIFIARGMELRVGAELPPEIQLNLNHRTTNGVTAFALVASDSGIAIVPAYASSLAAVHGLCISPVVKPVIERRFMLYRRHGSDPLPGVQVCRQFLIDYFGELGNRPLKASSQENTRQSQAV
jgi:DNA-binding transcriptional LysR family regulator